MNRFVPWLLMLTLVGAPFATEGAEPGGSDFTCFAVAVGCPGATNLGMLEQYLNERWRGQSKQEIRVRINRVIGNRGALGAMAAASGRSFFLSSAAASLHVRITYSDSGKVTAVTCSIKERRPGLLAPTAVGPIINGVSH